MLTRHAVDLSLLQYSCAGETLYLYGSLKKDPKGDFKAPAIEILIKELMGIQDVRSLQFDLTNWNINADYESMSIAHKK
jgi:hypothetical protein